MENKNRILSSVYRGQQILISMVLLGAVIASAKGPANARGLKKEKISAKFGAASGSDQVLTAVYDSTTNSLRVEGVGSGSGGTGTVTSVGLSLPSIFTVSGSPVTTSGTLAATLASQNQNLFLASPNGAAGAPSFRALNIADLPPINFTNLTGSLSDSQLPADAARFTGTITAGDCAKWSSSGVVTDAGAACGSGGASGTVTSVGLSLPSIFAVSGSPVTTTGTLGATLASQGANLVLASPSGAAGAPSFRTLNIADLPAINFTNLSGVLSDTQLPADAARFTGTITAGDCAKWSSSGVVTDAGAACGSGSGSTVIQVNGVATTLQSPINFQSGSYIAVSNPGQGNIQVGFSGVLAPSNGGTGLNTLGTNGQCLGTNGSVMQWQSCGSGGSGTVTSVGLSLPAIFTVNGSPVTNGGTLTGTLTTQSANLIFAGPSSGVAATPTFRALVSADIPALNYQVPLTTYSAPANEFLTGFTSPGTFTVAQPGFANLSGAATLGQLPATLAQFTGTITAGDCAKWSSNGVVTDAGAACGAGGGFTAAGDLSGTSTSQTVIGLQGKSLAAPTTANTFPEFNGTSIVWAAGTGTTNPGGASTQLQFNNGGAFGGSSNLTWNNATSTLTVNGTISATAVQTAGNSLVLNTAACSPGPGATSVFCSNTGNVPSISANGGTVTPIAPLIGDLGGSWTAVYVNTFHLTGDGNTQSNAVITQVANDTAANTSGMAQIYNASGSGTVETFTVVSGFQPFQTGDSVNPASCGAFDGGSVIVTGSTSTTFTVNGAATGSATNCSVTSASYSTRSAGVVTLRIFPEPFTAGEGVLIASCGDTSFQAAYPVTITSVGTGSITYSLAGAGTSTNSCTASSGTKNGYLAKATSIGARFAVTADTAAQTFIIASGGGITGDAHFANTGQAQCVMDTTALNTEGEAVIASPSADSECTPTASPGSAYVIGYMISNSTTAGSEATVGVGTGYLAGSGGGFTAGGDLSGTSTSQNVIGMHFGATDIPLGTAPSSGQCLEYNGTNITGAACSGGGSSSWSGLANSTANLTLNNAAFTSEFDQSTAASWKWANTTAATSSTNQSSPIFNLCGQGWEGATPANTQDCWTVQQVLASGANPMPTLTFLESGSSTAITSSQLATVSVPELETTTIESTPSANMHFNVFSGSSFGFYDNGTDLVDIGDAGDSDVSFFYGPTGCYGPTSAGSVLCAPSGQKVLQLSNNNAPYQDVATNGVNNIAYSTAPVLDLSKGNVQQFTCTTAGAAISPTTANLRAGHVMQFIFIQNGTTACTLTWPSTIHGGGTIGTTLSGINVQSFVVSNNGTDLYATAAMVTNMTGGTP